MKGRKPSRILKSFQDLKGALNVTSLPAAPPIRLQVPKEESAPEPDEELFRKAMEGVAPVSNSKYLQKDFRVEPLECFKGKENAEVLKKLEDLINEGKGFVVSDTPEYIEGTGYHIHPEIARRLHRGDFSIQAHIDLHGLNAEEAKEVYDQFMKWAVFHGKTGVLVTHGRGLSSPSEPVLKKKVEEWLNRGPWRKWVVAYSSARRCDGGAGATYVLLRQQPLSKRMKLKRTGDAANGRERRREKAG